MFRDKLRNYSRYAVDIHPISKRRLTVDVLTVLNRFSNILIYCCFLEQTVTTVEAPPTSPEIITISSDLVPSISKLNLPTLSLSIPVPDEDNTEKHGFNLQKDVLDAESITSLPVPAKSVFTNVRERFQARKLRSPEDDESDPFAFREEVYTPPLRKRKRISRNKEETGTKKRKSQDTSGINVSSDDQVGRNDGQYNFRYIY